MSAPITSKFSVLLNRVLRPTCKINQKRLLGFSAVWNQNSRKCPDVCQSPDKSMIMCWHPEPDFPYEHTQPLVRDKTEMTDGESVLKVQYLLDDKLKNCPEGPTEEELCKIFYTSKRVWRLRPRHDKRMKMRSYTPVDRESL